MQEYSVSRVNISYSKVEDRLRISCSIGAEQHYFWLSQRMLKKMLPPITKYLSTLGAERLFTSGFIGEELRKAQETSKESEDTGVSQDAQTASEGGSSTAVVQADLQEHDLDEYRADYIDDWLCVTVNLSMRGQVLHLRFLPEDASFAFFSTLSQEEASQLLLALRQVALRAEWSIDWPDWLVVEQTSDAVESTSLH